MVVMNVAYGTDDIFKDILIPPLGLNKNAELNRRRVEVLPLEHLVCMLISLSSWTTRDQTAIQNAGMDVLVIRSDRKSQPSLDRQPQ
jgi:hypothetical protein